MARLAIFILSLAWSCQVIGQSVSDSLIHLFKTTKNDSLRVEAALKLTNQMIDQYPDSLYLYLEEAIPIAKKNDLHNLLIRLLLSKGQVFDRMSNYVESQKIYFQVRKIIDSVRIYLPDSVYYYDMGSATNNLALVYFKTGKLEDAQVYFREAISYLDKASVEETTKKIKRLYTIAYNNLGGTYLQAFDYDPAEVYYLKALSYLEPEDKISMSSILNNLGIIEKDRGNYDKAMDYLTRALEIRLETGNMEGVVQSLNNLGTLFWFMGKPRQALDTLKKANRLAEENHYMRSQTIGLELLSLVYEDLGDDANALKSFRQFKVLYDSLMNQQNLRAITQLELQQRFEDRLQNEKVKRQEENLQRQRKEAIYIFTLITALLLISMLVMLFFLQRNKIKRQQLTNEKDRLKRKSLELENDKLTMDLEYKNKELTTNVMHLARTNEFITSLSQKLLKNKLVFTRENQRLIDEMIREIQSFSDVDTWKEFELRFQEVHSEFYTKLNDQFPNLTSNEKKLCAFLRLNMTTKEISALTYQSVTSITVARSRLRKKIGIDKDENLVSFLESL